MDHIGANCAYEECHQHDFLPFMCSSCEKVHCLNHRSQTAHKCEKLDNEALPYIVCKACKQAFNVEGEEIPAHSCVPIVQPSCTSCSKKVKFTVDCSRCDQPFCVKCRLPETHKCKALEDERAAAEARRAKAQATISSIKASAASAASQTAAKPVVVNPKLVEQKRKIEFMRLKHKAKGDNGLPQTVRRYLTVQYSSPLSPSAAPTQSVAVFLDSAKTVGVSVETVARTVGLNVDRVLESHPGHVCSFKVLDDGSDRVLPLGAVLAGEVVDGAIVQLGVFPRDV